jgi:Rieske Fe-S protein
MTPEGLSRRHALAGAATLGLGAAALTACGNDATSSAEPPAASSSGPAPAGGNDGGEGALATDGSLATTDEIEVGGGVVFGDQRVVVTQPAKGDFKAFTAVCTHQGCLVSTVSDGTINCPCHDSKFSIEDGSVEGGPATSPLSEVKLDVRGNKITLA